MDHNDIVVALDGSERSLGAMRWAARQSSMTGERLVVLHAFQVEPESNPPGALRTATESVHRSDATAWLRRALDEQAPAPRFIQLEVTEGHWSEVLRRRASKCVSLVVLGVDGDRTPDVSRFSVPVVLVPTSTAPQPGPGRSSASTPAPLAAVGPASP